MDQRDNREGAKKIGAAETLETHGSSRDDVVSCTSSPRVSYANDIVTFSTRYARYHAYHNTYICTVIARRRIAAMKDLDRSYGDQCSGERTGGRADGAKLWPWK